MERYFYPEILGDFVTKYYSNQYKYAMRSNGSMAVKSLIHNRKMEKNVCYLLDVIDFGLVWVRHIPEVQYVKKNRFNISELYLPIYLTTLDDNASDTLTIRMIEQPVLRNGKQVFINVGWCDYLDLFVKTDLCFRKNIFLVHVRNINTDRYIDNIIGTTQSEYIKRGIVERFINKPYYDYMKWLGVSTIQHTSIPHYKKIIENQFQADRYLLYCDDYDYTAKTLRQISTKDYPKINKNHNVVLNDDVFGLIKAFMGISSYWFSGDPYVAKFCKNQVLNLCRISMSGCRAYQPQFKQLTIKEMLTELDYDAKSNNMTTQRRKQLIRIATNAW